MWTLVIAGEDEQRPEWSRCPALAGFGKPSDTEVTIILRRNLNMHYSWKAPSRLGICQSPQTIAAQPKRCTIITEIRTLYEDNQAAGM